MFILKLPPTKSLYMGPTPAPSRKRSRQSEPKLKKGIGRRKRPNCWRGCCATSQRSVDSAARGARTGPFFIAGHGNRRARKSRPAPGDAGGPHPNGAPVPSARGMEKGPRRAPRAHMGRKRKGAPRRGSPAAPPRPSPPDAGRAPSTGQRRPALPRADPAVPSALGGLASGFGMGPGVPRPPWPLTGGRRSSLDDENASHA